MARSADYPAGSSARTTLRPLNCGVLSLQLLVFSNQFLIYGDRCAFWFDRRTNYRLSEWLDDFLPARVGASGVLCCMCRAQRRTERGGIGRFKSVHRAVVYVGIDAQNFCIGRGATRHVERGNIDAHPARVDFGRERLRFYYGAHVGVNIRGI